MILSKTRSRIISNTIIIILLVICACIFIFPLFWMLSTSLKTIKQVSAYPPVFWPKPPMWKNYIDTLNFIPFAQFFKNTVVIATVFVIGNLISCTFVAFGFARFHFPGRDLLFLVLISTMMMPIIVTLIPLFVLYKNFGWINTYYPLTVPAFFGEAFYIFLVRQFYRSVPFDITDAAIIDGCSYIGIWWRIMVPLSKPVLAAIIIFAFQEIWNDFLKPLIFLSRTKLLPLSVGLYLFKGTSESVDYWHYLMAASVLFVLPMVIIFLFAQKYFVRGVVVSGMKV